MEEIKFAPSKLEKLNNPERLKMQDPDLFWPVLGLKDPKVIVDIGTGTGFFAVELLKKAPTAKVYGLDIAPVMLEWIKANRPEFKTGHLVPLAMTEDAVPLQDGLADLVVMINLHHELHNPQGVLSECRRVLKSGGRLMVLDWKPTETPMGPPPSIRVQPRTVLDQVAAAGFLEGSEHFLYDYFFVITATCP